jgi:hypothetical protein
LSIRNNQNQEQAWRVCAAFLLRAGPIVFGARRGSHQSISHAAKLVRRRRPNFFIHLVKSARLHAFRAAKNLLRFIFDTAVRIFSNLLSMI